MAIVFISLNVCFMVVFRSLNVVLRSFTHRACVVPLAPAVMTMSGLTFHPRLVMSFKSGWYFCILFSIVSCGNLLLQYVNSINYIVRLSDGFDGGSYLYGSHFMQKMSSLSLALQ